MVRYCLILFLSTAVIPVFSQESIGLIDESGGVELSWEAIPAVYRVEIKQDGKILYVMDLTENKLKVKLEKGVYEYQVSFLDPFGNIATKTGWKELVVRYDSTPWFRVIDSVGGWVGDDLVVLEIDSSALKQDTAFQLEKDDLKVHITGERSADRMKFMISTEELSAGSWDLVAINSAGSTYRSPGVLQLNESLDLNPDKLDTLYLLNDGGANIEIHGENFDKNIEVVVRGKNGEIPVKSIKFISRNRAELNLELTDSKPGDYSIILTSLSGKETHLENALVILDKNKHGLRLPGFEIQAGYSPMISFVRREDDIPLVPSLLVVEAAFIFNSGINVPFLRSLGVGIHGSIGLNGPGAGEDSFDMMGSVDLVINWRPRFNRDLSPSFELAVGNMWFNFISASVFENYLYARLLIAADIMNANNYFQIGTSLLVSFGQGSTITTVGLVFRRGMRF